MDLPADDLAAARARVARHVPPTPAADTFVDGVACRTPDPDAVARIVAGAARIVRVTEAQAGAAMALMYRARRVAIVHTGGNAEFSVLARALVVPPAP